MEKFDLYDRNRIPLGRSLERGTKPEEGEYRMVVHVCILNSKATKMLIQKRLKTKHPYPGKWDVSCGGSVISGETSDQGAHRELLEEIGIDVDFNKIRPAFTKNFDNGFNDIYILQMDVDPKSLKLQSTEVEKVEWASRRKIKNMIKKNKFIDYYCSFIDYIFDLKKSKGYKKTKKLNK